MSKIKLLLDTTPFPRVIVDLVLDYEAKFWQLTHSWDCLSQLRLRTKWVNGPPCTNAAPPPDFAHIPSWYMKYTACRIVRRGGGHWVLHFYWAIPFTPLQPRDLVARRRDYNFKACNHSVDLEVGMHMLLRDIDQAYNRVKRKRGVDEEETKQQPSEKRARVLGR